MVLQWSGIVEYLFLTQLLEVNKGNLSIGILSLLRPASDILLCIEAILTSVTH